MVTTPIFYAVLTFAIAIVCGLIPVYSKIKEDPDKLKILTGITAGIIIGSAMFVVIPEGYELATTDSHGEDDNLAGSVALVILEVDHGDINASEGIEEIESLIGGHGDEVHEEDSHDEHEAEGLSGEIEHVIEEVEDGDITASAGIEEIEVLIMEHSHEAGHEEHTSGFLIGGALLAGFILMLILEGSGIGHAIHEEHHDHSNEHGHSHVHHSSNGWMLVFGLSLHAATDGLAVGAAATTGSLALTATVALAVLIHKGPAAFSLGVFSMHERASKNETIRDVLIFSLATPIMIMFSYFLLSGMEIEYIGLAMLFSAGTFLYVATVDTLPDIHNPVSGRKAMQYVVIGTVIMAGLIFGADLTGLLEHNH